jgi:hypothetical protein
MTDLPPHSVACALELVGAVHDHDHDLVAHTVRNAAANDGLEALAVCLAAMVDDERTVNQLLAWNDHPGRDVTAWRYALTDEECRHFRNAYNGGDRSPDVADGNREFYKRAKRRAVRRMSKNLRSVA